MKFGMCMAVSVLCASVVALAGCGTTAAKVPPRGPARTHTISAAQAATKRGIAAECKPAQSIDTDMNSGSTVAAFDSGVSAWESELTAANNIPLPGVPVGHNSAREIAVDYAKANFALALASESDNPFASGFSMRKLRRGYNMALSALQDVLDRCAANGDY